MTEPATTDLSPAAQQYVRAIYDLQQAQAETAPAAAGRRVTTSQLAESMGLRAASITAMLQKLAAANPPLIEYTKHQGARLTGDGRRVALALVRRHRLLEAYLYERLDYRWDEVHDEAQRLEPMVTDLLAERLAEALGQPTRDPHGHAIPGPDLAVEAIELTPLSTLRTGDRATIVHVSDGDPALLRSLDALGLKPDAVLVVVARRGGAQPMTLSVGDLEPTISLPIEHAGQIFVRHNNRNLSTH